MSTARGDPSLAARLARELEGEVLFDAFSRGRYSTDASIYQIEPIGVVVPKTRADIDAAIGIARDAGVPVLPRGAGTSQCGQTVGEALVVDVSKYLNGVVALDTGTRRVRVERRFSIETSRSSSDPRRPRSFRLRPDLCSVGC